MELDLFWQPTASIAFSALIFNIFVCREALLTRTFRTPLALTGRAIDVLEQRYNRPELTAEMRRSDGVSAIIVLIFGALIVGFALAWGLGLAPYGWLGEALIVGMLAMLRTHLDQSQVLTDALQRSTAEARATLALMSGIDTTDMRPAEIARLSVGLTGKVIAEGFVAPLVYYILLGLPGLLVFKIVNTASTMIDEKTAYGADFGWAASRLNDLLMWPMVRLAAAITVLACLATPKAQAIAAARAAIRGRHSIKPVRLNWILATIYGAVGLANSTDNGDRDRKVGTDSGEADLAAGPEHIDRARRILVSVWVVSAILLAAAVILRLPLPAGIF